MSLRVRVRWIKFIALLSLYKCQISIRTSGKIDYRIHPSNAPDLLRSANPYPVGAAKVDTKEPSKKLGFFVFLCLFPP
jgi:hypothetical protein